MQIYISDANRTVWYGLIQDEWSLARDWTLTAGVRYDHYSDFGSTTNPRAALVWEARYDLTCKLLYGQAFRAPSFAELYIKNNTNAIGNKSLEPEEIETWELAFDYQPLRELHTMINFYIYKAENLIEYTGFAVDSSAAVATNYGEQIGHGFEIEVTWLVNQQLELRANLAYQHSENDNIGSEVPDAPALQFALNPHYRFADNWSLDGQYFLIADRKRESADPRDEIDDYQLVNLTLRRKNIAKHWEIAVSVRNLFNEDARESSPYDIGAVEGAYMVNDYPLEGRAVWAELSCRF